MINSSPRIKFEIKEHQDYSVKEEEEIVENTVLKFWYLLEHITKLLSKYYSRRAFVSTTRIHAVIKELVNNGIVGATRANYEGLFINSLEN